MNALNCLLHYAKFKEIYQFTRQTKINDGFMNELLNNMLPATTVPRSKTRGMFQLLQKSDTGNNFYVRITPISIRYGICCFDFLIVHCLIYTLQCSYACLKLLKIDIFALLKHVQNIHFVSLQLMSVS